MTKEELEVKIELIEKNIEFIKEMMAYNKKFDRGIIVSGILAFIFILIVNIENKDIVEKLLQDNNIEYRVLHKKQKKENNKDGNNE